MCLGSLPEASLKLAKADLHGICHVNDTKDIYLHGNCHGNLSCDFVLTWEYHVKVPVSQFLTWEFHVAEPSKPANPPLRPTWESHGFRGPQSVHLHGILCRCCMILQQAFPTWNPHVDLVAFRNSHGFPMWEGIFLWPLIWVSHVNSIK